MPRYTRVSKAEPEPEPIELEEALAEPTTDAPPPPADDSKLLPLARLGLALLAICAWLLFGSDEDRHHAGKAPLDKEALAIKEAEKALLREQGGAIELQLPSTSHPSLQQQQQQQQLEEDDALLWHAPPDLLLFRSSPPPPPPQVQARASHYPPHPHPPPPPWPPTFPSPSPPPNVGASWGNGGIHLSYVAPIISEYLPPAPPPPPPVAKSAQEIKLDAARAAVAASHAMLTTKEAYAAAEEINKRYRLQPYGAWPSDGTLPGAGVLVHCFDGNAAPETRWRPGVATGGTTDDPSASVIFQDQNRNGANGKLRWAPGALLFGHACASGGGIILRPRKVRIRCAHSRDYGARCDDFCPHVSAGDIHGPTCMQAWAPQDVGPYLARETAKTQQIQFASGHYNEFIVNGMSWDANLPWSVDAFLSSRDGEATKSHAAFLKEYGLTAGDVPLLMMTPSFDQPFVPGSGYARLGDPTGSGR